MSAEDHVLDVRTAVKSSDLLNELPDLRVDDSDEDEPVLLRADGRPVDTWRERYVAHLPAAGEIVLFDRSWYNRAGVERVMGFCTSAEYSGSWSRSPASSACSSRTGST
jgi:Polyphosphate kinase 2 (PPK2)